MAKRANPFIEDFVQQSKIHVSLKQFNNNEDRLQKVYEKTLELLFKGARKAAVHESPAVDSGTCHKKDKLKQLCIGKDGTLSHTEPVVPNKSSAVSQCSCGNVAAEAQQCSYCEKKLCLSCCRDCSHCEGSFCAGCSLIGYEGSVVCVSCYN